MCESPTKIISTLTKHAEPSILCSADGLAHWSDFPKGLRVLLFAHDASFAADVRSKLEQMDYIVSPFVDEKEALKAVSSRAESFHVAIVEVTTGNSHGCFGFLETAAGGLPTIMVSEVQCISTMMKCIALGAAEFLQKPLSEDKLWNIWQHVVHKAFNGAGGAVLSKSLKPIKEAVASILQLHPDAGLSGGISSAAQAEEHGGGGHGESPPSDRFPAPSTPQLQQSSRSVDEEPPDQLAKLLPSAPKSVDNQTGSSNSTVDISKEGPPSPVPDFFVEEEIDSAYGSKITGHGAGAGEQVVPSPDHLNGEGPNQKNSLHPVPQFPSGSNRASKKRLKVDWTTDLHKRFVRAVEQLGIDQAIPSKILELMKVEGLTRHNVASHLQKYRMRKRHVLPREDDRIRWQQQRGNPVPRAYGAYKHLVALPAPAHAQASCGLPPYQVYPVWGHPSYHHPGVHVWANTGHSTWQPSADYWPWKTYPRAQMHADAWGCPVVPPRQPCPATPHPHYHLQNRSFYSPEHRNGVSAKPYDLHPAEEEIVDEAVREALSKPWLPLPLGLKPPSTESVLAELHRLGVRRVPPRR